MASAVNNRNLYTMIATAGSIVVLLTSFLIGGTGGLMKMIPLAAILPPFVYIFFTERQKKNYNPKRLMNEVPTVIGMMSLRISVGGSFDSAVRDVADNGPKNVSKLFSLVVKNVDLRIATSIKEEMNDMLAKLHKDLAAFRRSMMMLISASEARSAEEKKRMIKDAENISLTGLREMSETYSSSLNSPCMLIFGLGVMVPMILMSVLPMLSIGGMFSVSILDSSSVAFITLVAVPGIVAIVVASVIGSNPFLEGENGLKGIPYVIPLFFSVPAFFASYSVFQDIPISILIAGFTAGIIGFVTVYPKANAEKNRIKTEEALDHMLFEIGNRLVAGDNFEIAMTESLQNCKDKKRLGNIFERTLMLSKGDMHGSILLTLTPYSKRCADMYIRVYEASLGDPREAGRLAISLGHQVQDQMSVKKAITGKLKSMMDMMNGTSMVFAPLIMGLSIVLLKPLSSVSGAAIDGNVPIILMVYLIELAFLISVLTAYLGNRGGVVNIIYRFSMMLPIALGVFTAFSLVNI